MSRACGDDGQALSSLEHLTILFLGTPPIHAAHDPFHPPAYPRLTPELQLVILPGHDSFLTDSEDEEDRDEDDDGGQGEGRDDGGSRFPSLAKLDRGATARARAIGQGGWSLGAAWENLTELSISGLSQIGVSIVPLPADARLDPSRPIYISFVPFLRPPLRPCGR
jgi:hypothetical protein